MRRIPAGIFLQGSPQGQGVPEERPAHEAIVAAFDLDTTEVTVAAYRACVSAGACAAPRKSQPLCNERHAGRDRHPVNCVDHRDAGAYCAFAAKRLPSESEWEYAATGAGQARRFSWGDEDPPGRACYNHPGGTCPVSSFAPGALGLYDMNGNVWEWTSTWFTWYPEHGDGESGSHKIFKGGSWSRWQPHWLRNRIRSRWQPEQYNAWLGFRCARAVSPIACPPDTEPSAQRCVRVRGTPLCEPGHAYNGQVCTLGGRAGAGRRRESATIGAGGELVLPPGAPGPHDEPVAVSRTPQHDADCKKLYGILGLMIAYHWQGADWHARAPLIAARGCRRRDTGGHWTSACCSW